MTEEKRIIDAIFDSETGDWFQAKGPRGTHWFSMPDFAVNEAKAFAEINKATGLQIVMPQTKQRFRAEIEGASPRPGKVATRTGWTKDFFVTGAGQIVREGEEVDVVTVQQLPKFRPVGSLEDWQQALTPFISGQTLPLFAVALGLSGAIIRFLPSDYFNPMVDFVGKKTTGKSTLGALASSVWAGDPAATEGGGENWNMTANNFDIVRQKHRDMLLFLDEAEGSGISDRERMSLVKRVVFTGATTKGKARMTDTDSSPAALRSAFLSTSNTPINDLLRTESQDVQDAALSRLLTIKIGRSASDGLPVLDALPDSFDAMHKAIDGLRRAVNHAYGTAGPAFVHVLADRLGTDSAALQNEIWRRLRETEERLSGIDPTADVRHRKILATIELAGTLATQAGVIPPSWGALSTVVDAVFLHLLANPTSAKVFSAQEQKRFMRYVRLHAGARRFLRADAILIPDPCVRLIVPGFISSDRTGRRELLVDPDFFKQTFESADRFVQQVRKEGRLRVHKSEPDRRQIHAPLWMRQYGFNRVFAIRLQ